MEENGHAERIGRDDRDPVRDRYREDKRRAHGREDPEDDQVDDRRHHTDPGHDE